MDINKFVKENKKIVKLFTGEDYSPAVKEIEYTGKIGSDENIKILYDILQNKEYKRILLVAPTASGKTFVSNELMKILNEYNRDGFLFCPSKIQNEQNAGKQYKMKKVIGGVKLDESLEERLRVSAVFDKANDVLAEIWKRAQHNVKSPVAIIDEAHILIEQLGFRENAINAVNELVSDVTEEHGGTVVFLTATPSQLSSMTFDLIINCTPGESYIPVAKKLTILETGVKDNFHKTAFEQILLLIRNGKIPFVRLNSKPLIDKLQKDLATEGIVSESVTGDDKTYDYDNVTNTTTYHNNIYDAVVNHSQLPRYTRDGHKKINCYLCTSVLECGTNILGIDGKEDKNLVPFFCVPDSKNSSPDAVEQFFNRVRYQIEDCYLLISSENYNDLVNTTIEEINDLKDVNVKSNDSNTRFEVSASTSASYRKICAVCNRNNVFCTTKKADEKKNEYTVIICKKSFIELEQIVTDQIARNKANFEILNTIFNGETALFGLDYAKTSIDEILKQPTISGSTNSLDIVKRDGDSLVIDNNALWKYAHDQHCKQYFFLKDIFYSTLQDRLGITNISVQKVESLNMNMKEIKDKVKVQTLETIKKEIENNANLLTEILDEKNIENLKAISKTDEFKSFLKFVKIIHNLSASYNLIRDSKKSESDRIYNELLKEKMKMLSTAEKNTIEKLAKMDELDYSVVKDEESVEIIKIVAESTYWELFRDGVKAGISVALLIEQIVKEDNNKANVEIYIQRTTAVKLLKSVDFDFARLGNTIIEKEMKIALEMFYELNENGNLIQTSISKLDLIKLQNKLNKEMKTVSSAHYTEKHAENLLRTVFNVRNKEDEDEEDKKNKKDKKKSKDKDKNKDKEMKFKLRSITKSAL
jgi:hypothetical protein